jgi:hypothetical protein
MTCKNCGVNKTIKAHLIPRVFCTQVQTGKSHAASITKNGMFKISQSGIWDGNILCDKCDGKLGTFENYVHKLSQTIRDYGSELPWKTKIVDNADNVQVLKYCAGILYKYSLTTQENGRIDLGRYQNILRDFLFNDAPIPEELDVLIFRLIQYSHDNDVFAYRAPILDRQFGVNMYRMMMGGLVFFIKLDKQTKVEKMLIKSANGVPYIIAPASHFEEFKIAKNIVRKNEKLSNFLDKNP